MTDTSTETQTLDTGSILKELESGLAEQATESPAESTQDLGAPLEATSEAPPAEPAAAEASPPPERPEAVQETQVDSEEMAPSGQESATADATDPLNDVPQTTPDGTGETPSEREPADEGQSPPEGSEDGQTAQANDGPAETTDVQPVGQETTPPGATAETETPAATQAAQTHTDTEGSEPAEAADPGPETPAGENLTEDAAPVEPPAPPAESHKSAGVETPEVSGAEPGAGDATAADLAAAGNIDLHDVHLPYYVTPFGEADVLFTIVVVFILLAVFLLGLFYFKLHSLPEKMAHDTAQFQLVAIMALIALFTHNNMFWIFAILLAAIKLPDFITPVLTMAKSQERLATIVSEIGAAQIAAAAVQDPGVPRQQADTVPDSLPVEPNAERPEGD